MSTSLLPKLPEDHKQRKGAGTAPAARAPRGAAGGRAAADLGNTATISAILRLSRHLYRGASGKTSEPVNSNCVNGHAKQPFKPLIINLKRTVFPSADSQQLRVLQVLVSGFPTASQVLPVYKLADRCGLALYAPQRLQLVEHKN